MEDKKKRILLTGLATGTGAASVLTMLPGQWSKPVVSSVLLPVHAGTTGSGGGGNPGESGDPAQPTLSPEEIVEIVIKPTLLTKNPHQG